MSASRFPAYHRSRARLRRIMERLSFRNRLVLSHVMVLLLALAAMAAISALIEVWLGFEDIEGDVVLRVGLLFGVAAAFPASVALSRFLLRPLDRVRAATRRLAEGHYDDVLELPSEPGLAALVEDVNTLAAALADTERRRARLISEVAHEMRTPITLLGAQIEGVAAFG
uniref:HAMP domain-containing protein n=1 Tax=Streptomyces scabiei TaxID=1930 RepID=UPI00358F5F9B